MNFFTKMPWTAGRARQTELPFPAAPGLRVAQIDYGRPYPQAEPFPCSQWARLTAFRPQIIVGSALEILQLAEAVAARAIRLDSLEHAVFLLTRAGSVPAGDTLRVNIWKGFGVPLYELFVGCDNEVLAAECEVHEGWHVASEWTGFSLTEGELAVRGRRAQAPTLTGLTGEIVTAPCRCGFGGPRLMRVRKIEIPARTMAAAS